MTNKKFELTNKKIIYEGRTLYRIRALKAFSDVEKGELGGFVQKESNLDYIDGCWLYDDSKSFDNAWVHGDACIYCRAVICNNARVFDYAIVTDNALITDDVWIYGNAFIDENDCVFGDAKIDS